MRLSTSDTPTELSELHEMSWGQGQLPGGQIYEPLLADIEDEEASEDMSRIETATEDAEDEAPFSWVAYFIFMLLGVAMLWAWNMFLAAAPFFQRRFAENPWILNHFQPAQTSVATFTNLISMVILSSMQENASYPRRIIIALITLIVFFTILALSTFVETSARAYFALLLAVVLASSMSSGFIQNGGFSFTVGFGRIEYTQAIMVGQAVAGVLPPLTQIVSVLAVSMNNDGSGKSSKSAFAYFLTAAVVSAISLGAFFVLLRRKSQHEIQRPANKVRRRSSSNVRRVSTAGSIRDFVPMQRIFMKVPYLAVSVILCFAVTLMVFPICTAVITSVNGIDPAIFIPLGFLVWNIGDLLGRLSTIFPKLLLTHHPFALFCLAMARLVFVPLYFLCNIKGRGAKVSSDFFYLFVVQFLFGLTNGYLGSSCMIGAADWVAPDEREAAGGFMALFLVIGLTLGSLLSFTLGNI